MQKLIVKNQRNRASCQQFESSTPQAFSIPACADRKQRTEAGKFCTTRICAEVRERQGKTEVPPVSEWDLSDPGLHSSGWRTVWGRMGSFIY